MWLVWKKREIGCVAGEKKSKMKGCLDVFSTSEIKLMSCRTLWRSIHDKKETEHSFHMCCTACLSEVCVDTHGYRYKDRKKIRNYIIMYTYQYV